jgi:trimethylamine-N-oxide reductase (cytochrome c)
LRDEAIEFLLVQHPWMENDTVFADIILPAATLFECSDIANDNLSGQWGTLFVEEQAVELVGEAKSDHYVVCEVARALEALGGKYEGRYDRYTQGLGPEEKIRKGFDTCGKPDDLGWDEFKEKGFWLSKTKEGWQDEPAGLYNFYVDPENNPLQSPTGKIEYYSETLARVFPDDVVRAPYPQWVEKGDGHDDRWDSERARLYPYLLVTNHPRWRVHTNHDDIPWIREIETCKVKGPDGYLYEPVWINPLDAKQHGIENGDVVKLFNGRGAVLGGAYVTERIRPQSVYQDHGARIDSIIGGTGGLDRGGSNNLICPDAVTSKNAAGEVTNSYLVGLEKVDAFALAAQYPEQFGRDYDPSVGLIASAYITEGV